MPKMRTHKGTAKRFKLTGSGKKIVRGNAFKSHILEKKSPKRKRGFAQPSFIAKSDERVIRRNLGL
jgi:large subunit ribosomal protein L35